MSNRDVAEQWPGRRGSDFAGGRGDGLTKFERGRIERESSSRAEVEEMSNRGVSEQWPGCGSDFAGGLGDGLTIERRSSSRAEFDEMSNRDVAEQGPGRGISPAHAPAPSRVNTKYDLAGHNDGCVTARGSFSSDDNLGSVAGSDVAYDDRCIPDLPEHLYPPHRALSATRVQHPPPNDPLLPPRYREEKFRVIPSTDAWEYYEQRKLMMGRHHWKLANQNMTTHNARRCLRMLGKHQWKLVEFIAKLEREGLGQTDRKLMDWLIQDHKVLLEISKITLHYFEFVRMPIIRCLEWDRIRKKLSKEFGEDWERRHHELWSICFVHSGPINSDLLDREFRGNSR